MIMTDTQMVSSEIIAIKEKIKIFFKTEIQENLITINSVDCVILHNEIPINKDEN